MKVGYARVSTENQDLDTQVKDLYAAGCDRVFHEKISAVTTIKPELEKALRSMSAGDVLMVVKLDRLGLRTIELVSFLEDLNNQNIGFQSISDRIEDSDGAINKTYRLVIDAFAELERDLMRERTRQGFDATRVGIKRSGPKEKVPDDMIIKGLELLATKDKDGNPRTGAAVAKTIGLSRSSFYRRIKNLRAKDQKYSLNPPQTKRLHPAEKPS